MQLSTRFIIAIAAVLLGFVAISILTVHLITGIHHLNRADTICNEAVNTLKELQLVTSQLLITQELDNTSHQWQMVYAQFEADLKKLNTSPEILNIIETQEQENILRSMNMFWEFTKQKTALIKRDIDVLQAKPDQSRDGLIYQYSESNDHELLVIRNEIYTALLFLEAEFEIRLTSLRTIVRNETSKRFNHLIIQISLTGLLIALIISTILFSFLNRLKEHFAKLHHVMAIIGKGDFTEKLDISGSDELSMIARAVNKTSEALADMHKELEHRLNEISLAKEKAEAASKTKSFFLANMSHEIRTPLNAVIGFSELLSTLVTDKKQKSYLISIQTAGNSLLTLLNDILDLSKIEADKIKIQYSPCDLRILLNDVEQVFFLQASKKEIQYYNDIDESLPSELLLLDEIRLRQVLFNIVGNAVKFTREGHIKVSAKVIEKNPKSVFDLHISVEDTGIGIPHHEIERIFDSFEQQEGQDNSLYGGTGLGLTISRRLVEMMNGQIWVDSHVNRGSTFNILIHDVKISSEAVPLRQKVYHHEGIRFEKGVVLVVDDTKSNRDLMCATLTQVNLITMTAVNGQEAIDKTLLYQPDIILMDLQMPVMDGIEAMSRLRSESASAQIPIIAISASSAGKDPEEFITKGFDGFVSKPINIDKLIPELSRYLTIESFAPPVNDEDDMELTSNMSASYETIDLLESRFMNRWEAFNVLQPMEEVKRFGEELKNFGLEHNLNILSDYGDEIATHVDNFDVTNMKLAIDDFPRIIHTLKAIGMRTS